MACSSSLNTPALTTAQYSFIPINAGVELDIALAAFPVISFRYLLVLCSAHPHHVEAIANTQVAHQRGAFASRPRTSATEDSGRVQTNRARGYRPQAGATVMARHLHSRDNDDELA